MIDVAGKAARAYARRVWWAEPDELKQEAMIACLDARRTWNPDCGVPLNAYAWRACMLHLRAWCWRQSAPVHGDSWRPEGLRGLHRAPVTERTLVAEDTSYDELVEAQWVAAASSQIRFLLTDTLGDKAVLAERVLLRDEEPHEVAQLHDIKVEQVYRATRTAKAVLADNRMLFDMLKEKVT